MDRQWIVIANAARARILERTGSHGPLVEIVDLVHPESRQHGRELDRDRPGHSPGTGPGQAGTQFDPRTDSHERERQRFAQEVAAAIEAGQASGRCQGVVLVASDPFLGLLKAELGAHARAAVRHTIAHDYTSLSADALASRLNGAA